jgi:hypothetical protein
VLVEGLVELPARAVRWCALVALGFSTWGCCKAGPTSRIPTAADAIASVKKAYSCCNGVFGEGKLDHFGDRGRVRGDVTVFAVNPARVRVDVMSPFGAMLYTLTSNGKDFELLDFQEKTFQYGPATACNLARLTQVPVPGHVLVSLLRGEPALLVHASGQAALSWDCDRYVMTIPGSHNASQRLEIEVHPDDYDNPWDRQRLRVTRIQTVQQGVVLYDAKLDDHEPHKTLPTRVDEDGLAPPIPPSGGPCNVEVPGSIRIAHNPPLPSGAFKQVAPDGVRKRYVTCIDAVPGAPSGKKTQAAPR